MFDLGVDPAANAGKIYGSAYDIKGAGGLLGQVFSGTSTATAEDVQRASFLPRIQLARSATSQPSDAGTIAVRYPGLAPIAKTLEADTSADQVNQTFMELAGSMEMMEQPTLPTLSLGHYFGRDAQGLGAQRRGTASATCPAPSPTPSSPSAGNIAVDLVHGLHARQDLHDERPRGPGSLPLFPLRHGGTRWPRHRIGTAARRRASAVHDAQEQDVRHRPGHAAKVGPEDMSDFIANPEAHQDLGDYFASESQPPRRGQGPHYGELLQHPPGGHDRGRRSRKDLTASTSSATSSRVRSCQTAGDRRGHHSSRPDGRCHAAQPRRDAPHGPGCPLDEEYAGALAHADDSL